eukprot:5015060-Pyramimonas_sp.AAC.2
MRMLNVYDEAELPQQKALVLDQVVLEVIISLPSRHRQNQPGDVRAPAQSSGSRGRFSRLCSIRRNTFNISRIFLGFSSSLVASQQHAQATLCANRKPTAGSVSHFLIYHAQRKRTDHGHSTLLCSMESLRALLHETSVWAGAT